MVEEKVIKILAEFKEIEPSSITLRSTFEELEIDSLDIVELLMSLEDEFNITIEMDEELKTVGDVVGYIENNI